ncbi:MAG: hypothetical protein WAL98_08970 [Desulfatiglandaceae bacterium]|jgi:hypothetical protein
MSSSRTKRGGEQEVRVSSYAGYQADERPLHFILEERKHVVKRVLDQWREPDDDFFKVETEDGQVRMLKRDREADRWFVI